MRWRSGGGRQKGTCVSEGDHFRALQFGGVLPSPCGRRVGPLMLSPPPPTTEVVVFSPISPRVGGGWFYTTSPSIGVVGFFRQPQHGVVAFPLPAPAWGGGALLCQTRQAPHQPQYGGRLVFFSASPSMGWWFLLCLPQLGEVQRCCARPGKQFTSPSMVGGWFFFRQPQLGEVERCCARQGKQLSEWLVCAALAARWQPLGKEWSTPPIFATHPGVKPLGGVAPGWQAEVGGQAASFPR